MPNHTTIDFTDKKLDQTDEQALELLEAERKDLEPEGNEYADCD